MQHVGRSPFTRHHSESGVSDERERENTRFRVSPLFTVLGSVSTPALLSRIPLWCNGFCLRAVLTKGRAVSGMMGWDESSPVNVRCVISVELPDREGRSCWSSVVSRLCRQARNSKFYPTRQNYSNRRFPLSTDWTLTPLARHNITSKILTKALHSHTVDFTRLDPFTGLCRCA